MNNATLLAHLVSIRDTRGDLNSEIVVEEATDTSHPLHDQFDWNDATAGHKYRLEQAAKMLRTVRITRQESITTPTDLRAFVAVRGADTHRASYVPTEEALADDFTRELVLRQMRREWETLRKRYQHMEEFAAMIAAAIQGEAS